LVVSTHQATLATWVQEQFGSERLRIYSNHDPVGVEMAGALKNVIAIAAGICDGLGYGDNAKAALLTRGLVEMQRFGVAHGADPATFTGLAGIGDLMTTCFSGHGRNRRLGERIGQGESLTQATSGPQVAEGVTTCRAIRERIQNWNLEAPILAAVDDVLHHGVAPQQAVCQLLARRQKGEVFVAK
jgi:glycerol-3-phosphate dehydrogenase (NAD(P)+)